MKGDEPKPTSQDVVETSANIGWWAAIRRVFTTKEGLVASIMIPALASVLSAGTVAYFSAQLAASNARNEARILMRDQRAERSIASFKDEARSFDEFARRYVDAIRAGRPDPVAEQQLIDNLQRQSRLLTEIVPYLPSTMINQIAAFEASIDTLINEARRADHVLNLSNFMSATSDFLVLRNEVIRKADLALV